MIFDRGGLGTGLHGI